MSQPQLAVSRNQPDPSASPDVILPSQFYNNAGDRALISEQRLMLAVLADAINILQNWRVAAGIRKRQLYIEAEQWVFGSRQQRPFSFEYVCDALGMDPQAIRRRLTRTAVESNGLIAQRPMPMRLRLKESSRAQHLTVNRVRIRRHRRRPPARQAR